MIAVPSNIKAIKGIGSIISSFCSTYTATNFVPETCKLHPLMFNSDANKLRFVMAHRPEQQLPASEWQWYQEWHDALFFHWKLAPDVVAALLPARLQPQLFDGHAWISLVPFSMRQVRPRRLPSLALVSDFHEVNLRTYVTNGHHHGVYFFSLEAEKTLSAYVSRTFSGLPYEKSVIRRGIGEYSIRNSHTGNYLQVSYEPGTPISRKTELDKWLTERYYLMAEKNDQVIKFNVHHPEWELREVRIKSISLRYNVGNVHLTEKNIELAHFSPGVQVLAWPHEII